jgi:hypothetical protein
MNERWILKCAVATVAEASAASVRMYAEIMHNQ